MPKELTAAYVSFFLALVAGLISLVLTYKLRSDLRRAIKAQTLEGRLAELIQQFEKASSAISAIELEISTRRQLVGRLEEDAKRAESLKALSEQQVEAVAQTLEGVVQQDSRRSRWVDAVMGLAFTLLGFGLGLLIR